MPQTTSTTSTEDRAIVKAKVLELNRLAQDADTRMREALAVSNPASANVWRVRRDNYNAESKRLSTWLNTPAPPTMTPEEIRKRLTELPYKIQYADKMLTEYQRVNNAAKINEWARELQTLEAEQTRLLAMTATVAPTPAPTPAPRPVTPAPTPTPAPRPVPRHICNASHSRSPDLACFFPQAAEKAPEVDAIRPRRTGPDGCGTFLHIPEKTLRCRIH